MGNSHSWSTEAELHFLDDLGAHTGVTRDPAPLLRGYLAGAEKRTDWGNMDRDAVIAHAKKRLERIVGG
jgi:hypothetical protein